MTKRRIFFVLAGVAFGVFLVWILFRTADPAEIAQVLARADWRYLLLAIVLIVLTCAMRWIRLRALLCPRERAPLLPFFTSMQASDLLDMFIPVKPGALLRPYLLTVRVKKPFSQALAATIVDRLVEVSGIFLVVSITVLAWPLEQDLQIPPDILGTQDSVSISQNLLEGAAILIGVLTGGAIGVLIFLYFNASLLSRWASRLIAIFSARHAARVQEVLQRFAGHLHVFVSFGHFMRVMAINLTFWGCYLGSIGAVFSTFGLDWPWYSPMITMTFVMVLMLGPNVPGFVGQYHIAIILSILTFSPETPTAAIRAIAIAMHLVHMGSMLILGLAALALTVRAIRIFWKEQAREKVAGEEQARRAAQQE